MIRPAEPRDLNALCDIETRSFPSDRISRKSYSHLIRQPSATVLVEEDEEQQGTIRGSLVLLFRRGLAIARIYSIVVAPEYRGMGIAKRLIAASQEEAIRSHCLVLRLEVREDNADAIALYQRLAFNQFGQVPDYYEDGATALRFEKATLAHHTPPYNLEIPYYVQTFDFTCGAASLMMVLKRFNPAIELNRTLELELWREATTIFMTSGIGGCSAQGLALAAIRRGLHASVFTTDSNIPFIDSVRNQHKKEAIEIVHTHFQEQLAAAGHPVTITAFGKADIIEALERKAIPILLISGYRLYKERTPHWVVVTGFDEHFIYIHDPYIPDDQPAFDGRHVPIYERDFMQMNRYGRAGNRTMLIIEPSV